MAAFANPEGGQVAAGNVEITSSDNTLQIKQTSQKAIIDWRTFNIAPHEHTQFQQPSASSIALNRVNPANGASSILGRLSANGQIWILNPAGIFFGGSARVDVGGLLATTANITNEDFLKGNYRFTQSPDWNGAVINEGTITAADRGLVALVAPGVENRGVIKANLGKVVLAATNEYSVDFYGDQLINFGVNSEVKQAARDENGKSLKNAVSNSGTIIAHGGTVILSANAAEKVVDHVVNMSGHIKATSAVSRNGEIILMGGNQGTVTVSGKLIASGRHGGNITITGKNIHITSKAKINASGKNGGGTILIGGDAHGAGPLPRAEAVRVDSGAKINASALKDGNGGKVVVWSDHSTEMYGDIQVQGGQHSGNGGWIETSSKNYLDVNGATINAKAPFGKVGTWLLDPTNIYIASSQANATGAGMSGTDNSASTGSGSNPVTFAATTAVQDSFLLTTNLVTALASANVIVTTTNPSGIGVGNITVVNPFTWTSTNSLTLTAANNIAINGAITTGAVGSSLILNAGGNVTQTAIIAGAGSLVQQGAGTTTLSQANTYTGGTIINGGTLNTSVLLAAGSNVGTGGITINNGSTFVYTGATATAPAARTFSIGAGGGTIRATSATGATLTIGGGINLNANALTIDTIGATPANIAISTTAISGAATGSSLTKTGAGQLTINVASTYGSTSSSTNITGGTIANGVTNALPITTALTVDASGTYNMNNSVQTIGSLSGSGIVRNTGATSRILTVGDSTSTTFSGTLGNAGGTLLGLTKVGTGTLTLSGTSGYTGATLISAGTLQGGATNALSSVSAFTVTGTLDMNSFAQTLASLAGAGTVTLSANLTVGDASSTTFSGLLNGSSNLLKNGTGTLTLSGAVSGYTGTTNINAGTILVSTNANALGIGAVNIAPTGATASSLSITNLAIANALNFDSTNAGATLTTTGTQTFGGLISLTGTNNTISPATSLTLSNIISGSGNLTKAGAGTLVLSGLNTYTGKTTVSTGTLSFNTIANVGSSSALGAPVTAANGTIDLGAGILLYTGSGHSSDRVINLTGAGTVTASGTGALNLTGGITSTGAQNLTLSGTATGAASSIESGTIALSTGTLTKTLAGTWILTGDNNGTYSGTTTISTGTLQIGNGGTTGQLGSGNVTNNATLIFNRSNTMTVTNNISGTGAVTQSGTGVVILTPSVSNTYSGVTTLNSGTLQAGAVNAFSPNTAFTLGTVTSNILDLNNFDNTIKSLAGGATFGEVKLGTVTGGTLTLQNTANTTYSGIISGLGGVIVNAPGFTQTFAGANTYTGATSVNAGTLSLTNLNALGSGVNQSSSITVLSGAALNLGFTAATLANNKSLTLNGSGVSGAGALTSSVNNIIVSNAITLNTDSTIGGANSMQLTGPITDNGGNRVLTKAGAGTITLNNSSNSYGGGTVINAGTLSITNANALGTTGAININNAGILSLALGGNTLANSSALAMSGTASITGANSAGTTDTLNNDITASGTTNTITSTTSTAILALGGNILNNTSTALVLTGTGNIQQVTSGVKIISGTGNLTKSGTGTLTLANLNTYSGITTVTAGTVNYNSIANADGTASALGAPASIVNGTIGLGAATLLYTGSGDVTNRVINLTAAGILTASGTGTLTLNSNGSTNGITATNQNLTLNGNGFGVINSVIATGSGTLTESGTGTWTLGGANTYTGLTTVSAGTLVVSNATGLGDVLGATTVSGTGTLQINNVTLANESITLNNGATLLGTGTAVIPGTISFGGTSAVRTISAPTASDSLTLSGALNGAVALTLGGSGTITLDNAIGNVTPITVLLANANLVLNNGNITTSSTQTYNNSVVLGADTLLKSAANSISFALSASTIDNATGTARALTINTQGAGGITLVGNVGTGVNGAIGAITLNTSGTNILTGSIEAASLTTDVGGATTLNTNSITTSGDITFNEPVTLASLAAKNYTSTAGSVNFNSTLTGAFAVVCNPVTLKPEASA